MVVEKGSNAAGVFFGGWPLHPSEHLCGSERTDDNGRPAAAAAAAAAADAAGSARHCGR